MAADMNAEIERLAPFLWSIKKQESADVEYRIFSDAFVWSDEIPDEPIGDDLALKYLLRYRTSLLIGQPIAELESYWEAAKIAWQGWPGLSPERCQYSVDFKEKYDDIQANEDEFLESFND